MIGLPTSGGANQQPSRDNDCSFTQQGIIPPPGGGHSPSQEIGILFGMAA